MTITRCDSVWKEWYIFTMNGELHFYITFRSAIAYFSMFFARGRGQAAS